MPPFEPIVMLDAHSVPYLVFRKGRRLFHAVTADPRIRIVSLETLRGLRLAHRKGQPYPPRRAASFWLNHSVFPITARAKAVLRGLVRRQPREAVQC